MPKGTLVKVANYKKVKLEPVNMAGAKSANIRWLISKADGAPNFAMRLFELKPAGHSPLHTHPYEHEVYVLEGEGTLVFSAKGGSLPAKSVEAGASGGEGKLKEYPFKKEYCIYVPPDKEHQFKNTGKTTLKFLCCIPNT